MGEGNFEGSYWNLDELGLVLIRGRVVWEWWLGGVEMIFFRVKRI